MDGVNGKKWYMDREGDPLPGQVPVLKKEKENLNL